MGRIGTMDCSSCRMGVDLESCESRKGVKILQESVMGKAPSSHHGPWTIVYRHMRAVKASSGAVRLQRWNIHAGEMPVNVR